jgi:hypothetical protein
MDGLVLRFHTLHQPASCFSVLICCHLVVLPFTWLRLVSGSKMIIRLLNLMGVEKKWSSVS